jgi:hypothetical protein
MDNKDKLIAKQAAVIYHFKAIFKVLNIPISTNYKYKTLMREPLRHFLNEYDKLANCPECNNLGYKTIDILDATGEHDRDIADCDHCQSNKRYKSYYKELY